MASQKQNNQLNEKNTLQDLLFVEKEMVKMYSTAITESCGNKVRSAIKTGLTTAIGDQYAVFNLMNELGYYEPAPADKAVIDKQKDKFEKIASAF